MSRPIVLLVIAFSFAVGPAKAQEPPHFAFPSACRLVGKRAKSEHLLAGVYTARGTLVSDGGNVLKGEIVKRVTLE